MTRNIRTWIVINQSNLMMFFLDIPFHLCIPLVSKTTQVRVAFVGLIDNLLIFIISHHHHYSHYTIIITIIIVAIITTSSGVCCGRRASWQCALLHHSLNTGRELNPQLTIGNWFFIILSTQLVIATHNYHWKLIFLHIFVLYAILHLQGKQHKILVVLT